MAAPSAGGAGAKRRRCVFLDVDIDGHRAAHERAREFVAATNLRYGFTSGDLAELGGSEKKRVAEYYAEDYTWSTRGRIELGPAPAERLVIELFDDVAPTATANFFALCDGSKGLAKGSGKPLHYCGSKLHRVIAGFMCQGGDFVMGNGCGGESIWGGTFKDEKGGLSAKFDRRGIVGMCNAGKNSNGSQFFITFAPAPKLNGRHVAFGAVVAGWEVLDAIEARAAAAGDVGPPPVDVVIVDCGALP